MFKRAGNTKIIFDSSELFFLKVGMSICNIVGDHQGRFLFSVAQDSCAILKKLVVFLPLERHCLTNSMANTSVCGFTYFNRMGAELLSFCMLG